MGHMRFPDALLSIALVSVALFQGVVGQGNGASNNRFVNPPASNSAENPVWTLGDQQVISWVTTLPTFNISIWQQSTVQRSAASGGNVFSKVHPDDQVTNFTWTVQTYGFDLNYSPIFFFWINSDTPEGFTSNYFNITRERVSTTSTATSTTSATSTNTATPPAETLTTTNAPGAQTNEPETGLTPGAKVGLGVGLGVGIPLLAILAGFLFLKCRQSRQMAAAAPPVTPSMLSPGSTVAGDHSGLQKAILTPREVDGAPPSEWVPELPDRRY
ncbi:hypothetical protein VTN00DRAFT_919 [Thermoascus crustaceus]|uniref:uncharacterized protein n=1 Tax=Thermoascus crustaceus TaxID=5088 RepID=UPI003742744A